MRRFIASVPTPWQFVFLGLLLSVVGAGALDAGLVNVGEALVWFGLAALAGAFISWAERDSNER